MRITRRSLLGAAAATHAGMHAASGAAVAPIVWDEVVKAARGSAVAWNAWAGDDRTNAFIAWVAERMQMLHDVKIRHVRLRDTSEAVARVVAERAQGMLTGGKLTGGSVDLIWINGADFLSMKQAGLLFGPFLDVLPHATLIDRAGKPGTMTDCTIAVDAMEVPWRMAQIVFVHDIARIAAPPRSMAATLLWAAAHPGRLTHPTARNVLGASFLTQALMEMAPDRSVLQRPATDATFGAATAAMWTWYTALRPHLWRHGRVFPDSAAAQRTLMCDGEIDIMVSLNPAEAATSIANGTLPDTTRDYVPDGGTIGHCSFNAIPCNATHKAAAMLTADFLLSPEAQAHAMDARYLGSPTVLALDRLSPGDRALFDREAGGSGSQSAVSPQRLLPQPHPSWMIRVAMEWERRATL